MLLKDKIPPLFHSLCPDIIRLELPEEIIADCQNCVLSRSPHSPYINTKCCSYHPQMSNFMCGAILSDRNQMDGREIILEKIRLKRGVTPYGILPDADYTARKQELDGADFWSKPKELLEKQLCPFYSTGACSVWKYRDHLCATYFCSSIGGASGKRLWKAVDRYLKMMQIILERHSMIRAGWPVYEIFPDDLNAGDIAMEDENGNVSDANYRRIWGDWVGKEEEFYLLCYKYFRETEPESFRQFAGLGGEILESCVIEAHRHFLKNVLPDQMRLSPDLTTEEAGPGRLVLRSDLTSYEVPVLLMPLIKGFDGLRSTKEVFNLGYDVLYNMDQLVDGLLSHDLLIKVNKSQK